LFCYSNSFFQTTVSKAGILCESSFKYKLLICYQSGEGNSVANNINLHYGVTCEADA